MKKFSPIFILLLVGCVSSPETQVASDFVIEELRTQLADASRAHHTQSAELQIIEDKIDQQRQAKEEILKEIRRHVEGELSVLELKVSILEKEQEKLLDELITIKQIAERQENALTSELDGIKGALEALITEENSLTHQSE